MTAYLRAFLEDLEAEEKQILRKLLKNPVGRPPSGRSKGPYHVAVRAAAYRVLVKERDWLVANSIPAHANKRASHLWADWISAEVNASEVLARAAAKPNDYDVRRPNKRPRDPHKAIKNHLDKPIRVFLRRDAKPVVV